MGYIAIRHWDCYDQWFIAVDNVTIVEGTVDDGSASNTFTYGQTCTVTATPNTGYSFVNWTENGSSASANASYTFTVTGNRDLVANFSDQQPAGLLGDVNLSGNVDINDVLALMRHALQITILSNEGLQLADVNGDGSVNINDAVALLRIILGIV